MSKKRVHTENAPAPVGPYSQAIAVDGWVYVAGQVCIDPATGEWLTGDIKAQTELVLKNIQAIVEAAGGSLADVVKTTIYLTDLGEFADMNEVYAGFFSSDPPPARATVEVAALPKGCKIEVDAVAKITE